MVSISIGLVPGPVHCLRGGVTEITQEKLYKNYKTYFINYKLLKQQSGIPITPAQIDALIAYLDRDGDGEIDFR